MNDRICLGHKAFSLVRFFDAYQRNELGREAGETPLIFALSEFQTQKHKCESQKLSPSATSFLLMSVKRNGSKEKRFPVQGKPGLSLVKGFFYKTSLSCRKTLHIHVQRPPGLQALCKDGVIFSS